MSAAIQNGRPFFIIWNPASPKPPTVRFATRAGAQAVAERMATRFGQQFFVCKALSASQAVPVTTVLNPKAAETPEPKSIDATIDLIFAGFDREPGR